MTNDKVIQFTEALEAKFVAQYKTNDVGYFVIGYLQGMLKMICEKHPDVVEDIEMHTQMAKEQ